MDTSTNKTKAKHDPTEAREFEKIYSVLRGEISAMEAYAQVMESIKGDPESERLQEFLRDHRQAVEYWKDQVDNTNIESKVESGPWGAMVEAFVGSAKLFGNKAALLSLQEGEEHGLREYREMLDSADVPPDDKAYIREVLIPNQERHINSIKAMINMQ